MQQSYSWLRKKLVDRNYIDQCKWHAIISNREEKGTCQARATPLKTT